MTRSPALLCRRLGLSFEDIGLLERALTHRSSGSDNNERLEFYGDAILGYIIAEYLFEHFPGAAEGILSRLRASLVNQTSLAELAREFDLGDYLILGSGELKSGGYRRDSILSDAFEAIIGALCIDQGVECCKRWILTTFHEKISQISPDTKIKDAKTRLQEKMQADGRGLPVYSLVAQIGQPHDQQFEVSCAVEGLDSPGLGTGKSRKKAEQEAASEVLRLFGDERL